MPRPQTVRSISRVAIENAIKFYTDADQSASFDPSWTLSSAPTGSRVFNGTTDRIDWSSVSNLTGSAMTVSAWIKLDSYSSHTNYIVAAHNSTDTAFGWVFAIITDGSMYFARNGAASVWRNGNTSVGTSAMVHVLVTHDGVFTTGSSIHVYKNGVLDDQPAGGYGNGVAPETASTGRWSIGGRYYDDARNLDGNIAQVGVWNRVLSQSEITSLALGNKPSGCPSGLVFDFGADTSSLVAQTGGTGTADGTSWSSSGPTLAGVDVVVNYGDGSYSRSLTEGYKVYATGKGRHTVRLTTPDWNRVTSIDISGDASVGLPSKILSELSKLTALWYEGREKFPVLYRNTQLADFMGNYWPLNDMFPTLETCPEIWRFLAHGSFGINNGGFYGPLPSLASLTNLAYFDVSSNRLSGQLPSFANNTALVLFECGTNLFTGSFPSFNTCTLLETFSVGYNDFTGTIPTMAACTALTLVELNGCLFTDYTAGCFATQKNLATLRLYDNQLSSAAVNAILADLVASLGGGRVGCTVQLHLGSNGAPTGQGITDKATLNGTAGWTVTTN